LGFSWETSSHVTNILLVKLLKRIRLVITREGSRISKSWRTMPRFFSPSFHRIRQDKN
jgi:hypothetical protein